MMRSAPAMLWVLLVSGCGAGPVTAEHVADPVHDVQEARDGDDAPVQEPAQPVDGDDTHGQGPCCGCGQECNTVLYACLMDAGDRSQKCNAQCMFSDDVTDEDGCMEDCSRTYHVDEGNCEGAFQVCGEKCDGICAEKPCVASVPAPAKSMDPACLQCLDDCGDDEEECMLIAVATVKKCEDQCVHLHDDDEFYDCVAACDPDYLEHEDRCRQEAGKCQDACNDVCGPWTSAP